jgi:hypothetical protein
MPEATISKLVLAQQQLETAIGLFVSRRDRVSAITLAGAADGILHGLVLQAGKTPFSDYAIGVREALFGETPSKAKFARHINDKLNINDLKHMDQTQDDQVVIDVDVSALGAILKAIANHHTLIPDHPDFIKAMLHWTWMFWDGERIKEDEPFEAPAGATLMDKYADRSTAIRKMESRLASKARPIDNSAKKPVSTTQLKR